MKSYARAIKSLQRGHSARQDIKLVLPGEIECSPKLGELSGNFLIKFVQANRVFMDQLGPWRALKMKNEGKVIPEIFSLDKVARSIVGH